MNNPSFHDASIDTDEIKTIKAEIQRLREERDKMRAGVVEICKKMRDLTFMMDRLYRERKSNDKGESHVDQNHETKRYWREERRLGDLSSCCVRMMLAAGEEYLVPASIRGR